MKKLFSLFIIMLFTAAALAGCGRGGQSPGEQTKPANDPPAPQQQNVVQGGDESAPQTQGQTEPQQTAAPEFDTYEAIRARGYFILGRTEFPPMGFTDENGEAAGFDIDFANAVAEKMGLTMQSQVIEWGDMAALLNAQTVDVIWNGCTISAPRRAVMDFAAPYLNNEQIIVVQAGSAYQAFEDLEGATLGIRTDTSSVAALVANVALSASLAGTREYDTVEALLAAVQTGEIDGAVVDSVGYEYVAGGQTGLRALEDVLDTEQYGVGVRKGDAAFLEALQTAIDACIADGTLNAIAEKWLGGTGALAS